MAAGYWWRTSLGEMSFDRETAEKVRQMIYGDAQPVGVIELEVFEFA